MRKTILFSVAAVTLSLMAPQFAGAKTNDKAITSVEVMTQDVTYQEIETTALPEAINTALSSKYSGYSLDKAWKGDDGSYKVAISSGDMKYDLFYTEAGELVKVEKPTVE
ncbi:hypothetical protein [Mangrovibacterium diazotrophicum]|uniref:PepSY-like beta-lactamase-inhibitor n=1 Tax=Mangrovibacterium diazotrophicum TaxID=1261403 RepID=A0A419VXR7_9BACT|nr:hypothetical protein [Mangrovibacterium diazotrophicum]RKD87870.1 hypothetical protein BC643_3877 [Mangrovibacterium diazotrophicum]